MESLLQDVICAWRPVLYKTTRAMEEETQVSFQYAYAKTEYLWSTQMHLHSLREVLIWPFSGSVLKVANGYGQSEQ